MIMAMSTCILQILACVFSLMAFKVSFQGIPEAVLNLYIIVFAVICFFVELRRFRPFRSMIYSIVKYFYFLTSYPGRACFYVFLGTISFNEQLLCLIAGGTTVAIGVLYALIHCRYKLPRFVDPEVAIAEAEERVRRETEQKFLQAQQRVQAVRQDVDTQVAALNNDVRKGYSGI